MAIVCCIILCSSITNAQNDTGVRSFDSTAIKSLKLSRLWYDSTVAMFQERFPIIRSIPPYSTDMPLDVLLSYLYIDSALKSASFGSLKTKIRSWTTNNDTMKLFVRSLYAMSNYDPIRFNQYTEETDRYQKISGPVYGTTRTDTTFRILYDSSMQSPFCRYRESFYEIRNLLQRKACKLAQITSEFYAIYAALTSDYIVRVSILSIDSTDNVYSPLGYKRYRVKAKVLDTLKGRVLATHCDSMPTFAVRQLNTEEDCYIYFQYTPNVYDAYNVDYSNPRSLKKRDSVFTEFGGEFRMLPGQEAVVFLTFGNARLDSWNDYYDIDVDWTCSNGALSITDNNVKDVNNVWSSTVTSPYSTWKSSFQTILNKILSGTF